MMVMRMMMGMMVIRMILAKIGMMVAIVRRMTVTRMTVMGMMVMRIR